MSLDLDKYIARVPNFPKKGILFYDISPLLANADAWTEAINKLSVAITIMNPDILVGIESRGFLFSSALAIKMNLGFAMIRKKGKLPGNVTSLSYNLEYGTDTLEIKDELIKKGQRIVIVDDLLATGGTVNASVELLNKLEVNVVGATFFIELLALGGRTKIAKLPNITTILAY